MEDIQNNHVKILFRYYSSILDQWTVETMWAEIVNVEKGLYRLDSMPFYGPQVASGDIIFAEYDTDEESVTYRRTIEYSGNSIIVAFALDELTDINAVRDMFNGMGCLSERFNDKFFSMEVLSDSNYRPIKDKLQELENLGIIDYAEPCLSDIHQGQI